MEFLFRPRVQRAVPRTALLLLACTFGVVVAAQAPRASLQGRITDVLGEPVPAAMLEVVHGGAVVGRGVSDGEGIYQIRAAALSGAELRVTAPGKAEQRRPWGGLSARGPRNMVLEDGSALHGTVTDVTGAAVRDAIVVVAGGDSLFAVATDRDGRYRVAAAPMRLVHVRAWGPTSFAEREVELRGDQRCDLVLPPVNGGRRRVRVDGLPAEALASATLEVTTYDLAVQVGRGTVPLGADGTAEILLSDNGIVRLRAPGFAVRPRGWIVSPRAPGELVFAVVPEAEARGGVTLRGMVLDAGGHGVVGARLVAEDRLHGFAGACVTGEGGGFRLQTHLPADAVCRLGLEHGDWQFDAEDVTHGGGYSWLVTEAQARRPITLRVTRGSALRSELAGADGQQFVFGEVVVAPASRPQSPCAEVATDRLGRFALRGLPEDGYMLAAVSDRGEILTAEVDVRDGRETVVRRWQRVPSGTVAGRVVDRGGEPVPGVAVHLVAPEYHGAAGEALAGRTDVWVRTDRNGRFRCQGLQVGEWLVALGQEKEPGSQRVDVEDGRAATADFRLER